MAIIVKTVNNNDHNGEYNHKNHSRSKGKEVTLEDLKKSMNSWMDLEQR